MLKNLIGFIPAFTVIILLSACNQQKTASTVVINNQVDSVSYAIGMDIGKSLQKNEFGDINADALAKGLSDSYSENEGMMSHEDATAYINGYIQKKQQKVANENLKKGEEFLAENKEKEGVITTESGLQYKILKEGNGPIPTKEDRVSVYYKGTRLDGTEFDSTKEGKPVEFAVTGVIRGWTEALQLMPVGSKWELYIHPNLAYGAQDRGTIKANDVLIFEIELLDIVNK
ncbi:MAG: FKBP-type peptidyl-prolyl cis-trans isomerase [Bacteroidetes bacterium]|nr:FKBP-type peptidyl-prolyl cis-trans isomerase [Bacteroidota bacterium]